MKRGEIGNTEDGDHVYHHHNHRLYHHRSMKRLKLRVFARAFLDGHVVPAMAAYASQYTAPTVSLLRKKFDPKIQSLVLALEPYVLSVVVLFCFRVAWSIDRYRYR